MQYGIYGGIRIRSASRVKTDKQFLCGCSGNPWGRLKLATVLCSLKETGGINNTTGAWQIYIYIFVQFSRSFKDLGKFSRTFQHWKMLFSFFQEFQGVSRTVRTLFIYSREMVRLRNNFSAKNIINI